MSRFAAFALLVLCGCLAVVAPPAPPEPGPDVVAPVPSGDLYVLIVEETANRTSLPSSQVRIFTSTKVLGWLRQNAPGRWRIWDKDVDASKAPAPFRVNLTQPRTSLPWIVIENGTTVYSHPLPESEAELLSLLERFKP